MNQMFDVVTLEWQLLAGQTHLCHQRPPHLRWWRPCQAKASRALTSEKIHCTVAYIFSNKPKGCDLIPWEGVVEGSQLSVWHYDFMQTPCRHVGHPLWLHVGYNPDSESVWFHSIIVGPAFCWSLPHRVIPEELETVQTGNESRLAWIWLTYHEYPWIDFPSLRSC